MIRALNMAVAFSALVSVPAIGGEPATGYLSLGAGLPASIVAPQIATLDATEAATTVEPPSAANDIVPDIVEPELQEPRLQPLVAPQHAWGPQITKPAPSPEALAIAPTVGGIVARDAEIEPVRTPQRRRVVKRASVRKLAPAPDVTAREIIARHFDQM